VSTKELRDELARIGDRAPMVDVPDDTFPRAQRARRRDRLAAVAAVVVVVGLVGGLAAWLPGRDHLEPTEGGGAGVPSTIWPVSAADLHYSDDLAVGQAAAAFMSTELIPVVISADDGTYQALDLPGFGETQRDQGAISLSPDGRHLAWGWSRMTDTEDASGVRIVDLVTGQRRSVTIEGAGQGVFVYTFAWSPDSRWLVWDGVESVPRRNAWAAGPAVAGRIGPRGTSSEPVPRTSEESTALAVGNDGRVLIATADDETWWDGRVLKSNPRSGGWYPTALTPQDGVLLETLERGGDSDDYRIDHRVPTSAGPMSAPALFQLQVVPLGWLDDGTLVATTQRYGDESVVLSLLDLHGQVGYSPVGELNANGPITVAVDLMTADRPTVERPRPSWLDQDDGWSRTQLSLTIGPGVVVLLSLLTAARWWWRRRQANAK